LHSTWQGELANAFAAYAAGDDSVDLSHESTAWTNLNKDIAQRYLDAYENNSRNTPDWEDVRDLHNAAYALAGVDADDWLPNKLLFLEHNPELPERHALEALLQHSHARIQARDAVERMIKGDFGGLGNLNPRSLPFSIREAGSKVKRSLNRTRNAQ
jgi:hypothetical protein